MLWGQRKVNYPGEYAPELMVAWDEYCLDANWEGYEEEKAKVIAEWGTELLMARELILEVPDDAIDALFETPTVAAAAVERA